jgi:glycosyltransferase involved in cell wall biosynthesis
MKVALLSMDYGEYCVRIANGLCANADVMLMLPHEQAAPYEELLDPRITLYRFRRPRLRHVLAQFSLFASLKKRLRSFSPDILHVQEGYLWLALAFAYSPYPVVLTIHDVRAHLGDRLGRKSPQFIMNFGRRRAAQCIVHAQNIRQEVAQESRLSLDRVNVVPHVSIGERANTDHVAEPDSNTVLFFGRIWPYKGLEYLIKSEPLISAVIRNVRFVIAGEGEDISRYRQMMVHPERFTLLNTYISDKERANLFRSASLVVLPYVEASQSGVIPVAYSFGKPAVVSRVGGLPEMVLDGETGCLVPPKDEVSLANAIIEILQNPALRIRMGENAKRFISSTCSPLAVAEQTHRVYKLAFAQAHG